MIFPPLDDGTIKGTMLSPSTWKQARNGHADTLLSMLVLFVLIFMNNDYHLTKELFSAKTCSKCFYIN